MDFASLVNHTIKIKQNEKRYKYLDLAKVTKMLRDILVTVMPIVNGGLVKGPGKVTNLKTNRDHR